MPAARKWLASLLLNLPAPLRSIRNVPVLGPLTRRITRRLVPTDEKVWAQVEGGPGRGLWLELNPRTGQQYQRGEVEPLIQRLLSDKLKPGMVFYDLGANIGFFSLLGARLVGTSGQVFSFEPDSEIASRLRRNIARNGFTNIRVHEAGVWSSTGSVRFVAADASSPDRGVGQFVPGETGESGTLTPCVSLDDFVRHAPPPGAIKCDVEGAEVAVFQGAETLLRTHRPWILCEMHSQQNDSFLRHYFSQVGYGLETIDAQHVLASPVSMQRERDEKDPAEGAVPVSRMHAGPGTRNP
jgi:FkbM family methyltransferase